MTGQLDGALRKVARARTHIASLEGAIATYLASKPYESDFELQPQSISASQPSVIPPDHSIGLIIGDCVCNLRAALDYVAWEVFQKNATPKPTASIDRSIYFPICGTPAGYRAAHSKWSKLNVPANVLSVFEKTQPFNPGYEILLTLTILVNQDKHRLPIALDAKGSSSWTFGATIWSGEKRIATTTFAEGTGSLTVGHRPGARDTVIEPSVRTNVSVFILPDVVTTGAVPVEALDKIAETVEKVVTLFAPHI